MSLQTDYVLYGAGLAPLVTAGLLVNQGRSVVLLNPLPDYFLEDSELPLDPFWPSHRTSIQPSHLQRSSVDRALEVLRPDFPGTVEFVDAQVPYESKVDSGEYHDESAPHIRARSRLWIRSSRQQTDPKVLPNWECMEEMYVESADAGLRPQVLEGALAASRFPGFSKKAADWERGILVPNLCDVDVERYRRGWLEWLQERATRIVSGVSSVEPTETGIRFHTPSGQEHIEVNHSVLSFWTPHLHSWIAQNSENPWEQFSVRPKAIRIWEHWSLRSRFELQMGVVGAYDEMLAWADIDGAPPDPRVERPKDSSSFNHRLSILRAGSEWPVDHPSPQWLDEVLSVESLERVTELAQHFLGWDKFTVRSMKSKAVFEWESNEGVPDSQIVFRMNKSSRLPVYAIASCDGPLVKVVRNAKTAAQIVARE